MMPHELDFANNGLVNTDWHNSGTAYVGLLIPNFFILYFGQKPPTGDETPYAVKLAFLKVGAGYGTWCTFAEAAIYSSLKIATVLSNAASKVNYNHADFAKKYFSKHWTGDGMQLTGDGPATPIMLVLLDAFPAEAENCGKATGGKVCGGK